MRLNHFIGSIIHLCLDQFIYNTAQTYKSLGPFLCGIAEIRLNHDGVLPVVHFTVHNSERVVFHRRISRNCFLCRRVITDIGQTRFLVFANDIPYRFSIIGGREQQVRLYYDCWNWKRFWRI